MYKHKLTLAMSVLAAAALACSFQLGDRAAAATAIAATFVAGQGQGGQAPQANAQGDSSRGSYPVERCMVQTVPAGLEMPFSFEWKECVQAVEVQSDGSMKVIFRWEAKRLSSEYLSENNCLTKGSDYQNPNMYMVDDLGNHYASTDVGTNIGICLLKGSLEYNAFTDYFMFPPARPGARFLVFHDDDQGLQTEPFDITWEH